MFAVILAAGLGTRLRPMTLTTPKPMLRVLGKPILEYTINSFPKEITDVVLVVHYLREQIEEYFGNKFQGRNIYYVDQPELIGTMDALMRCKDILPDERFLVCYSDDLYNAPDIAEIIKHDLAVMSYKHKNPERFGVILQNPDGSVKQIVEKPKEFIGDLVSMGVYILDKDIFRCAMRKQNESDTEYYIPVAISELATRRKIDVVPTSFWFPIGYPEDLQNAEKIIQERGLA